MKSKKRKKNKADESGIPFLMIIGILIIFFLLYIHRITKEDIEKEKKENEELKKLLINKEEKKKILDQKVLKLYKRFKTAIVLFLLISMIGIGYFFGIGFLGDLICIISASIFLISILIIDKPSDIMNGLNYLKIWTENRVYKNDKDLIKEIETLGKITIAKDEKIVSMEKRLEETSKNIQDAMNFKENDIFDNSN